MWPQQSLFPFLRLSFLYSCTVSKQFPNLSIKATGQRGQLRSDWMRQRPPGAAWEAQGRAEAACGDIMQSKQGHGSHQPATLPCSRFLNSRSEFTHSPDHPPGTKSKLKIHTTFWSYIILLFKMRRMQSRMGGEASSFLPKVKFRDNF